MEDHRELYRRLFQRRPPLELGPRWRFVRPSGRFGFLEIDPERTLAALRDEFEEDKLIRSRVGVRVDGKLALNPMLMTEDRLAAIVGGYDLVTSRGALVHKCPLFSIDQDESIVRQMLGPEHFVFLVGSMQEYLLFDSLGIAAAPTAYLDRLGRGALETMLHLVDGDSGGILRRRGHFPPGTRDEPFGYVGPDKDRPAEMCPVFVGYQLGAGQRGFTQEALGGIQRLYFAQRYLKVKFDEIYVWNFTDEAIADLEFRRQFADPELIRDFFRDPKPLCRVESFFESFLPGSERPALIKTMEDLLKAQDEAECYAEIDHYRAKRKAAFQRYAEQVDETTFSPLVQSAMDSNDPIIRSLRLNIAHLSRLIHREFPSIYAAQSDRLNAINAAETDLFPEQKWRQMEGLLNTSLKLIREEARIGSRRSKS